MDYSSIGLDNLIMASAYGEIAMALLILAASLAIGFIARNFIRNHAHKFTKFTKTTIDDEILAAMEKPVYIAILLGGLYLAVISMTLTDPYSDGISKIFKILGIILMAYATVRIINGLFKWYMHEIAPKTKSTFDDKYLPFFKKLIHIAVYGMTFIIILDVLGIEVTPILASLGIGGLAIALALQDTLTNFFAGAYIVADKPVGPKDYIKIDGSGVEGYVVDIGWRTTRIRTLQNNLVIVPNSKLVQSMIINYDLPEKEFAVTVDLGVSYESDLEKVEKVTTEVAEEVMKKAGGGVPNFRPSIRYTKFGESSIELSVVMRAKEFADKYAITHELIKALKKRYDKEGIQIPFPQRDVRIKGGEVLK